MTKFSGSPPVLRLLTGGKQEIGPDEQQLDVGSSVGRELVLDSSLDEVRKGREEALALAAIDSLPDKDQQEIIRMTFFDRKTPEQIAAETGSSEQEVRKLLAEATRELQQRLHAVTAT